jgi:hypothetical protein
LRGKIKRGCGEIHKEGTTCLEKKNELLCFVKYNGSFATSNFREFSMDKTTSLYLDVLRFSAAILVLLSHSATFLDIYLPVLSDFGSEAVAVFFVLSGYVISYVVAKKKIIPHLTLKQELLESILYLFQH